MNIIDNNSQQKPVTHSLTLQVKHKYLQYFIQFCETLSESIVYFEAEDTKSIDSKPEDLWQIDVYLDEKINLEGINQEITAIAARLNITPPTIKLTPIDDCDWVSEVQKTFVPIYAGRFFIHHAGYEGEIPEQQIAIEINAGSAFGTGEHETTSNCLEALSSLAGKEYASCLDMGCGSGILAIAMAKLLTKKVTAVDLDEQAVLVTQENTKLNRVEFIATSWSDGYNSVFVAERAPYQIITANILAAPLIAMAVAAHKHLAKDGFLILAGFLKDQRSSVLAAHQEQGLTLVNEFYTENWPALVMQKIQ